MALQAVTRRATIEFRREEFQAMRKVAGLLCILALTFGALASFAATKKIYLKSTTHGTPVKGPMKMLGPDNHAFAAYKAQNHLTPALNNLIKNQQAGAQYHNCTGFLSVPCFNSWFITGYRNSVYSYSMVGHSPKAGGTTGLPNEVIGLELQLIGPDNSTVIYDNDPNTPQDLGLSDVQLLTQGPLYDATTTYPGGGGLPADKGQFTDTTIRASFNGVKAANWHTPLNPPRFPTIHYTGLLFFNNGDWACFGGELPPCTSFQVVNINSISSIFSQIIGPLGENNPSTEVPIILTDYVTAFTGLPINQNCCVLGFHSANPGNEGGNSVQVWTWTTFIPHSSFNPFAPFGYDTFVMSHEVAELYHDPFVQTNGTLISPWVDGSVSFAQANLETGDVIEAMADADSDFHVPLVTTGGAYTYHTQNEALLPWFTRNPQAPTTGPGPGVYSWPNTNTLNNGHPCTSQGFVYGEGPGGFVFDDGSANGQCH
jgi:hypothetical protein